MTGNIGSLRTMSYTMMPMISSGGRTYVPVSPSEFGYSQFQYVAGYPAPKGQDGVSVDKIKILNTLIDQLVSMKQKNIHPKLTAHGDMDANQIDALIKQYQEQIQTVTATAQNLLYKPLMPQTGTIVNLVA
jgi:hypothetical protein